MSVNRIPDGAGGGFERTPLTLRRIAEELSMEDGGPDFVYHGIEVTVVVLKCVCKFLARLKNESRKWSKLFNNKAFRAQVGWYTFLDDCIKDDEFSVQGRGTLNYCDFDMYFDKPMYRQVMSVLLIKIVG